MSFAGKVFKNNTTGDIIKVIDSFENIAVLENKQKIDVNRLMDSNQYTEQIDPSSFFNNQGAYNILAEKIKNIPTHMIQDEEGSIDVNPVSNYDGFSPASNESAIIQVSEEDEKAELARKYGLPMDNNNLLQKQNDAFAKLLGEEADELPKLPTPVNDTEVQRVEVQRVEVQREDLSTIKGEIHQEVKVDDPIITMFKKTKRNVEFKINVEISDKIPRLDFIEMMEDSYEISMIDFLADEFTNKILKDPSQIRESIKSKIKQLVYGAVDNNINPPLPPADRILKEGKTPIKPTTTPRVRKPRAKKESTQK